MSAIALIGWSIGLLFTGAVLALIAGRRSRVAGWVATSFTALASLSVFAAVARVAGNGGPETATLGVLPGLGAPLVVALDSLGAFFLAVVALIAVLATLYSVEYMAHFSNGGVTRFYPVLLVFFAAIVGVLVAADFVTFLVTWELMTLTGFFLVTYERDDPASQRAGLKFFILTHAGTLAMLAAALILWRQSGTFEWSAVRPVLAALVGARPWLGHGVLVLLFLGFATKAGVLPMGDWLPDAHPAAPSGVSAALSGALVKLGVYGLVRFFCSLLPLTAAAVAWGIAIALAGAASLFVGTLTALRQTDTKRLMAFHTIGQIGYICLGLGVGIATLPASPTLGALALVGALFHAANHACFKACLFLGAGAVLYRTGERDMDRIGGLGAAMPWTAGSTTVASLAIAGVPPLNGFVSKWLIVATCLLAGLAHPVFLVLGLVAMFISLATLASFLKVLGAVFLGAPDTARRMREVPASMVAPQVALAALCVLFGVLPLWPLHLVRDAVACSVPIAVPAAGELFGGAWQLSLSGGAGVVAVLAPMLLLGVVAFLALAAYAVQRAAGAPVRQVPVWTGGEEHEAATVRYPASSLYLPFKHAFAGLYPRIRWRVPGFPGWLRRVLELDGWLFGPAGRAVERASASVSRSHVGVPQVYLLWIVGGAAVVLAAVLALVR